jgi:hypothetical protein
MIGTIRAFFAGCSNTHDCHEKRLGEANDSTEVCGRRVYDHGSRGKTGRESAGRMIGNQLRRWVQSGSGSAFDIEGFADSIRMIPICESLNRKESLWPQKTIF